jgi:lysozyme
MPKPLVIDLSHHQTVSPDLSGAIDAGIVGVIHKATEGLVMVDKKIDARYAMAKEAGLLFGAYHFLRPGDMIRQANFFLVQTKKFEDCLLACDFEVDGITLKEVVQFLQHVESRSGQLPVLYTGHTLKALAPKASVPVLLDLSKYRLWIAQYNNRGPVLPKGYKAWWLWQYSESGKIEGIKPSVDLNTYQGTQRALRQDWILPTQSGGVVGSITEDKEIPVPSSPDPSIEQNVAVVKEEQLGFWATLKVKIGAAFTGIGGITGASTYAQQVQSFGLSPLFWERIFWIGIIGFLGWIVIEIIRWFFTVWQRRHRTNTLVTANTSPNNSVTVIKSEEIEQYKKAGWVVVARS